ncbi:MAG: serine hydrolase domain-containing protein [Parasphingorhabdus sp.]|uniref:serine hydrolase domain-containing protein n=1 Tax=Parasphingorhabdus sp. TaxID=2709688 RepID=UPI003299EA30
MQACTSNQKLASIPTEKATDFQQTEWDRKFSTLMSEHKILTAGVAVIEGGKLVWSGNFGMQSPSVPASSKTQYNVGSVTKAVTAETVLRLVELGEISLDESMSGHWIDPDLSGDSRHEQLTPRIALIHKTGFPNWRFFTPERKLKFLTNPGEVFGYSGEGYEYLAKFAEKKTGEKFDALVQKHLFEPNKITNAAFSIDTENFGKIAQTKDSSGKFPGHYCYPENGYCRNPGSSTAADDLVITIQDYAKFLIYVMTEKGYSSEIAKDRNTVQSDKGENATVDCQKVPTPNCPQAQGYGLGWEVIDYGDRKIISHGGSDWHELALTYFDTASRDGVIIFLNAPNMVALEAMPKAIAILDPGSPMISLYQRWLDLTQAKSTETKAN